MKRNIPIACAAVGIIAIAGCSMITGATGSSSSGTQAMSACAPEPQSSHYVGFSVGGFPPNPASSHHWSKRLGSLPQQCRCTCHSARKSTCLR